MHSRPLPICTDPHGWTTCQLIGRCSDLMAVECAFLFPIIISLIGISCKLLQVFEKALKQEVLSTRYLNADETGIKVLDEAKKGKKVHQAYFRVYHTNVKKLVYFDYQKSRNRMAAQSVLATYKGYLQTDGYEVMMTLITVKIFTTCFVWRTPEGTLLTA